MEQKKGTKQKILDKARTLFNELGYNSVSLRDIAKAAGISEGNLTYYFQKKVNLMEELLASGEDTFPAAPPQTLEELDAMFLDMQQTVQKNLYFFMHYTQLSQISPKISQMQRARCREMVEKLSFALQSLQDAGLLRGEEFPAEYENIVDTLYLSILYWAPFAELRKDAGANCPEYRCHAWRCVYHLLTVRGRDAFVKSLNADFQVIPKL